MKYILIIFVAKSYGLPIRATISYDMIILNNVDDYIIILNIKYEYGCEYDDEC